MVQFLSKAFVSAGVVILGALIGIQTLNYRQVEATDPLQSIPEKLTSQSEEIVSASSTAEFEALNEVGRVERNTMSRVEEQVSSSSSQGPWPECVGKTGQDCVALIEEMAPDVKGNVFIIPVGSMVTMDYRINRVRVYVNEQGVVENPPGRG